jgi:hypothetical protein
MVVVSGESSRERWPPRPIPLDLSLGFHPVALRQPDSGPAMQLRIIAGSVDAQVPGISFRISDGSDDRACGISRDALYDLAGHHGLRGSEEGLFQALWPVIERLVLAKLRARRTEESGEILVGSADLLLYGFDVSPSRQQRRRAETVLAAK